MSARTMPAQKPGTSEQVVGTPWAFIDAVEARWGPLAVDLAATEENAKAPSYIGGDVDSLKVVWHELRDSMGGIPLLWLNPEFGQIPKWAKKCAAEGAKGARIFFLVPASVGANWFWDHVEPFAEVHSVGRIAFQGQHARNKQGEITCGGDELCDGCSPFPKDLMLCIYGTEARGIKRWRWKSRDAKGAELGDVGEPAV